jgi:hypothetical protein
MRPMGDEAWREGIRRIGGAPLQSDAVPHPGLSRPCINREGGSEFSAASWSQASQTRGET